jgi:hypothetical protein
MTRCEDQLLEISGRTFDEVITTSLYYLCVVVVVILLLLLSLLLLSSDNVGCIENRIEVRVLSRASEMF